MKSKLTNNLSLKIIAVLLAILIWVIVVNVSDPIIESTYSNVQVEILNGSLITQNNQTYEILDGSNNISVTVMAKRSINDLLGKENIKATADMAEYNSETGTVRIRLETNKYNDKIESIKSKTDVMEVKIEDLMKKQLRISPVVNGEPVEGYVVGDVTMDQNVVTVQGPESVVSRIDHATVEASVAGMSGSISTTSVIRYYDKDNKQLETTRLNGNISVVSLKVEVLATKTLPIKYNISGTPAEEYGVDGEVLADKKEITIAGKASHVADLTTIILPASAIDVTDKDQSYTLTLDLNKYLPDGIRLVDEKDRMTKVEVVIVKLETASYAIPKDNITITGIDTELQKITMTGNSDTIEVTLKGLPSTLKKLKMSDIKGTISVAAYMEERNLSELKEGVYDLPLTLVLPNGLTADENVTVECRIKDIE